MTEQIQRIERHLIETSVEEAAGTQVWWVDAISKEDALLKFDAGEGEIYGSEVEVIKIGEPWHSGTTSLDDFGDSSEQPIKAANTITVPRATWDALVKALVRLKIEVVLSDIPLAYVESHFREHLDIAENALTAANAVSHPKTENTPATGGWAITSESAANAVSDHFRGVTEMVQPLGWYCVSRDGLATQCADQRDAEVTAESANRDWPNSAPYRAVQLCEFEAHPQATEPAGKTRDPLDLGQYVNEANISANDKPVAVIEKLQAVINVKKGFQ